MPAAEDILALFRKHDREGHGWLGLACFARALVPLVAAVSYAARELSWLSLAQEDALLHLLVSEARSEGARPGRRMYI